ncbi:hypothetical protein DL93DRAFT_2167962 [Clavulina sp. PMI_390]|nr:hypothetical protein DL93DRAFT_2167962 [Clavulina sp. PMI_390]
MSRSRRWPAPDLPGLGDARSTLFIGTLIDTVSVEDQEESLADSIDITGFRDAASFSWMDTQTPTISVPGSPPEWTGHELPFQTFKDGHSRLPVYPEKNVTCNAYGPLCAALLATGRAKSIEEADIIIDRFDLVQLLDWSKNNKEAMQPCRIDIQVLPNNTLVFLRWEPNRLSNAKAYRKDFLRRTTRMVGNHPREGYFHAVSYVSTATLHSFFNLQLIVLSDKNIGGISLLVQFQVYAHQSTRRSSAGEDVSPLEPSTMPSPSVNDSTEIRVITSTNGPVGHSSLVEIITAKEGAGGNRALSTRFSEYFLAGGHNIIIARHLGGKFRSLQKLSTDDEEDVNMRQQRQKQQPVFRRLVSLIHRIRELVLATVGPDVQDNHQRMFSLIREDGIFKLYERTGGLQVHPTLCRAIAETNQDPINH